MAATGVSQVCYNHPDKKADFKCFDCKLDSVINLCAQCNIQVHSLDVFRAHKVEQIAVKDRERRLSQDINDIEKLIAVESDLLQNVLIRLKYCQQEEKDTLSHLIQLQTATKRRLAEIKECESRIDKAFSYLTKVSSMLTQCTYAVESSDSSGNVNDSFAPVGSVPQAESSNHVPCAPQEPGVLLAQGVSEAQNGPPEEHTVKLPDELKGKDIFPVSVVGSLARNGSFWMIKIGKADLDRQHEIQFGIRNHYQTHGYGGHVDVSIGALCATLNRFNKEFCRVRIESVANSGMVKIRFVDLGLLEEVPRSSLCQLPKEFVDIPFQALECCLLPDLDTQLPYEAKWCFKDLTFNKILMAALEGTVSNKKGHFVNHVTLVSYGEVQVCINTKVATLVEEQRFAQEDRPLQPKSEDSKQGASALPKELPSYLAPGADTKAEALSVASEEKEKVEVSSTVNEMRVADGAVSPSPSDSDSASTETSKGSSLSLRVEAAEFVPISPENSSRSNVPPCSAPNHPTKVPGILQLPVFENKPVDGKAEDEKAEELPDSQIPAGCVDLAGYNRIIAQCSMNMIPIETLPKARFIMIRSSVRRIVEGMKCGLWCWSPENNKRLSRIYNDQTRIGAPLFLLFAGPKSLNFCGLAQMASAVDPNGSCPTLNKPFWFASKMSGRCNIKWIYVHDLLFLDVLNSSNCGYNKWYLSECGNGTEIPNKLGQLVVKVYDSRNNFRSILQHALDSYLMEQQAVDPSKSTMDYNPIAPQESFPMSQEEDWDLEIEESLKASKSLEVEASNASPDEKEAVASHAESATDGIAPVETSGFTGDAASLVNDDTVHNSEMRNDNDSVAFDSVQEEDIKVVHSQEEVLSSQESDNVEAVKDQSQSCASLSFETSAASTSDYQDTIEVAAPSYQAQNVQEPAGAVPKNDSFDVANTSDWESSSPLRASGREVESSSVEDESSELNKTVNGIEKDSRSLTGPQQSELSRDILNECGPGSETVVDTSKETGDAKLNGNELPPGEESDLGRCGAVSDDDPDLAGDSRDSVAREKAVAIEGGKVDDRYSGVEENQDLNDERGVQDASESANGELHSSLEANTDGEHHGSSEDLLTDYEDLPVEIGKEHYVICQENLSSSGTFWARVHRTKEEEVLFVDAMKRMGDRIESKNEPLDDIYIYKHCAVKGYDDYWYRAHVEKTPNRGKVGIRLLDLGEYWDVNQKELRVLDDEFYAAPPAQAIECSVCYKNPANTKEKTRLSRLVRRNKKIKVLVKSYNEGTVLVEVLS